MALDILQVDGQRVVPGILIINIAYSMRGQISMTLLASRDLVLAGSSQLHIRSSHKDIPFIETYAVLHKDQCLVGQ